MNADDILKLAGLSRALDITPEQNVERAMAERLAQAGVRSADGQKLGGLKRAEQGRLRARIRRHIIHFFLYNEKGLPKRLQASPAGKRTIEVLMRELEKCGFKVSDRTYSNDIAIVGREHAEEISASEIDAVS
jgi:hypothetical protein